MMKFESCFLLVLLLCCTFALAEEPIETQTDSTGLYEYTLLESGSAEIIRYRGKDQVLEIPAELDGHPVTSIGEKAFFYCSSLTAISIPDSVTSIGASAFYNCCSLTTISIPDSVSSIGEGTFAYCDSLSTISIPDSVTSIGKDAFANCENLTLIVGRNSYAHTYAQENGLNFTYPDANDWLNS